MPAGRLTTGSGQEMTLQQWVATLPPGHRARQELGAMESRLHVAQVRSSILAFVLTLVLIATVAFLLVR